VSVQASMPKLGEQKANVKHRVVSFVFDSLPTDAYLYDQSSFKAVALLRTTRNPL
jgi:hypothetical protein